MEFTTPLTVGASLAGKEGLISAKPGQIAEISDMSETAQTEAATNEVGESQPPSQLRSDIPTSCASCRRLIFFPVSTTNPTAMMIPTIRKSVASHHPSSYILCDACETQGPPVQLGIRLDHTYRVPGQLGYTIPIPVPTQTQSNFSEQSRSKGFLPAQHKLTHFNSRGELIVSNVRHIQVEPSLPSPPHYVPSHRPPTIRIPPRAVSSHQLHRVPQEYHSLLHDRLNSPNEHIYQYHDGQLHPQLIPSQQLNPMPSHPRSHSPHSLRVPSQPRVPTQTSAPARRASSQSHPYKHKTGRTCAQTDCDTLLRFDAASDRCLRCISRPMWADPDGNSSATGFTSRSSGKKTQQVDGICTFGLGVISSPSSAVPTQAPNVTYSQHLTRDEPPDPIGCDQNPGGSAMMHIDPLGSPDADIDIDLMYPDEPTAPVPCQPAARATNQLRIQSQSHTKLKPSECADDVSSTTSANRATATALTTMDIPRPSTSVLPPTNTISSHSDTINILARTGITSVVERPCETIDCDGTVAPTSRWKRCVRCSINWWKFRSARKSEKQSSRAKHEVNMHEKRPSRGSETEDNQHGGNEAAADGEAAMDIEEEQGITSATKEMSQAQVDHEASISSNVEVPQDNLRHGCYIPGWDSDLTDLSSSDSDHSDGESEIDFDTAPSPSNAHAPTHNKTGLKIRLPVLATHPTLTSNPPAPGLRVCGIKRCNIVLPEGHRWKICDPCRGYYREYQRARLEGLRRKAAGLGDETVRASGTNDAPLFTRTPRPNLDLVSSTRLPSSNPYPLPSHPLPSTSRSSPSPSSSSLPLTRICTLPYCHTALPPLSQYRWKCCKSCRARSRRAARRRKYALFGFDVDLRTPSPPPVSTHGSAHSTLDARSNPPPPIPNFQPFQHLDALLVAFGARLDSFMHAQILYLRAKLGAVGVGEQMIDIERGITTRSRLGVDMEPVIFAFDAEFATVIGGRDRGIGRGDDVAYGGGGCGGDGDGIGARDADGRVGDIESTRPDSCSDNDQNRDLVKDLSELERDVKRQEEVTSIVERLSGVLHTDFRTTEAFAVRTGGIIMRFDCALEMIVPLRPLMLAPPPPSSPTLTLPSPEPGTIVRDDVGAVKETQCDAALGLEHTQRTHIPATETAPVIPNFKVIREIGAPSADKFAATPSAAEQTGSPPVVSPTGASSASVPSAVRRTETSYTKTNTTPTSPTPYAKAMTGQLEVAVVPDESHPLLVGQRTIVRFRMAG
ncbi:hypothetical protein BJ138DRAFT_1153384 [Hygrophoropsis aurantiaca]|uniref:Uncharacterized protein n=1 Tax=Hygrophoropsis aurantiaca TaxID=72124 RepID=A0ACB8AB18_9AGAM|nr:hypothetical protein BJ138DRAFT_1153384 [Hygrophoropsis aurantiaca]